MIQIQSIRIEKAENGCVVYCDYRSVSGEFIPQESYVTDKSMDEMATIIGVEPYKEKEEVSPIASFSPKKFR